LNSPRQHYHYAAIWMVVLSIVLMISPVEGSAATFL